MAAVFVLTWGCAPDVEFDQGVRRVEERAVAVTCVGFEMRREDGELRPCPPGSDGSWRAAVVAEHNERGRDARRRIGDTAVARAFVLLVGNRGPQPLEVVGTFVQRDPGLEVEYRGWGRYSCPRPCSRFPRWDGRAGKKWRNDLVDGPLALFKLPPVERRPATRYLLFRIRIVPGPGLERAQSDCLRLYWLDLRFRGPRTVRLTAPGGGPLLGIESWQGYGANFRACAEGAPS